MFDLALLNIPYFLIALFVLAVVTSFLTELFKPFVKIVMPVELFVILLSVVLSVLMYLGFLSYFTLSCLWYEVVAVVIIGCFIAFITMSGWDRFYEIIQKYQVLLSLKKK